MAAIYRFDRFTLDAGRRRLSCDGEVIAAPGKALDVLQVLLEHRGRTVEKDDLMRRVWPDCMVEEANLTQTVFVLRRVLGDEPSDPRYIATVARRGYRFIGDASEAETDVLRNRRAGHGTACLAAYQTYVKGRHYWSKRDFDGVRAAMRFFREALDLDPTYARAYVGLAECYVTLKVHGWPAAPDAFVIAKAAAAKALEIDPSIAEAHASFGVIGMVADWDWHGAQQSFRRAIELAPEYAATRNWYANYLAAQRRLDDAICQAEEAVRLDPLAVSWRMGVGHMLFLARRYEEAVEVELNALEIDPRFWLAHWVLGMSHEQLGDRSRAMTSLQQADECSTGNPMVRAVLGRLFALCGDGEKARELLACQIGQKTRRDAVPGDLAGIVHIGLGDFEAALDELTRAAREGSYLLSFLNVSPLFDPIRSHPRFSAVQRLVNLA